MTTLRTLIVDDEPLARTTLRLLLEADSGVTIVGESGDGPSAIRLIRELSPDLVFLDIHMPAAMDSVWWRRQGPMDSLWSLSPHTTSTPWKRSAPKRLTTS